MGVLSVWTAATVLVAGLFVAPPASAAGGGAAGLRPAVPRTVPVPVTRVPRTRPAAPAMPAFKATVSWPAAGSATVDLAGGTTRVPAHARAARAAGRPEAALVRAGDLPVSVGRVAGAPGSAPTRVAVSVAPHAAATSVGLDGLIASLHRADGDTAPGQVTVRVDYSSFARAYGGDFASRLRLAQLPPCALTTPSVAACRTQTPIGSSNDTATGTVSGVVSLPGAGSVVLALDSSGSGGGGDFTSTSLKASGSWSGGGSSGAFIYGYPIPTPEVPGGLGPDLKLSYDSQQVDGYTSATNNQPSWLGDGWGYAPGFVERSFASCAEVAPAADHTGDYCWSDTNQTMTISLGGVSTALVHDPSTGWHLKNDNGDKVALDTGAINGDDNSAAGGEYWVVTTANGTRYYFGLGQLPGFSSGDATTNSVNTEPVFSTSSGQPCYNATFKSSYCAAMAYRWNLDYVVDTHGDAIAYYYTTETNSYGADKGAETLSYVRGSYLTKITYGFRAGQAYSTTPGPAAQVLFTVNGRCNTSPTGCATSTLTSSTASSWPDVPFDLNCASSCTASKYWSPSFWTEFELTGVQTQVLVGAADKPVNLFSMTYAFPATGDASSPALWLASVTRQGQDAASSSGYLSLPTVTFDGAPLANRVNLADGYDPLTRRRMSKITTETGEIITVAYSGLGCASSTPSSPDTDTMLCYPQYWTPAGASNPMLDWFNKYVVVSVTAQDSTGGGPPVQTSYTYVGNPAWRYDDNPLAKAKYRTWDQWRGYATVRTTVGTTPDPMSLSQETYFRGMDGDQTASGSTTSATVTDSRGETVTDSDWLAGTTRETITYTGVNGTVVSDEISDPWSRRTATQSRSGAGLPTLSAYQVNLAGTRTYAPLASGATRESQTTYTRDSYGRATQTSVQPDVTDPRLDSCTTLSYADNTDAWILDLAAKTTTVSVACGTTPSYPRQMVSQTLNFYDGSTTNGAKPSAGVATMTQRVVSVDSAGTPTALVTTKQTADEYGRTLTATDGNGGVTTTTYTPATGAAPTTTTVSDPLGHLTTTTYDPVANQPTSVTDPGGYTTSATYDALGRRTAVWKPGEPTSGLASVKYGYVVSATGLSGIITSTLGPQGTYRVSETLYDALIRERETQQATLDGGRDITLSWYDSTGRKVKSTAPFYTTGAPDTSLVSVADGAVPSETGYVYDGAGRLTRQIAYALANLKWETDTSYQGVDQNTVTPPAGGTPTITRDDANGRTSQLQQFNSATPTGTPATTTTYTYTTSGKIASTTDPAGNTSSYTYDLLDRITAQSDPDGGVTSTTYDANGNATSTTDARGKTISNRYDADNRKIFAYDTTGGAAQSSATEIAAWVFDTKKTGYPTSATSISNGASFTHTTLGYNSFAEPTGDQTTIPAAAVTGGLAGTYTRVFSYDTYTGLLLSQTDQAAGGLAQETITDGYDAYGRPINVAGTNTYVDKLDYTEFDQPAQYTFGTSGTFTQLTLGYDAQTQALASALTTTSTASIPIDSTTYRYNDAQFVTQVDSTQGETGGRVTNDQCFGYNNLAQLTTAWTTAASGPSACATTPTAANAAATVGGYQPYWQSWAFDQAGNRSAQTSHDVTGNTAADVATGYAYPAAGSATDQPNTLRTATSATGTATTTTTYGYDRAGDTMSVTAPTSSQSMQWDDQGHLASDTTTTTGSGTPATTNYIYDATGSLLLRQDPTGTTLFLADEQLVLSGGTVTGTRYYRLGTTQVAARSAAGHVAYLIPDRQGSDVLQVDAATQTAVRESYTPYGSLRSSAPSAWIGGTGYVGGSPDPATGLVNLGAREYDPTTGRFLSLDPVMEGASPQQMNGYAYAGNDPTTNSDPTGKRPICDGPCYVQPPHAYFTNPTPTYTPPRPAARPDYVVFEYDLTVRHPWIFVPWPSITPLHLVPNVVLRPNTPPRTSISSLIGEQGVGCAPFLGAGVCAAIGRQIAPTTKERGQIQPFWTPPSFWLNTLTVEKKLIPITFSFSFIIARNGHTFGSVGVGVGAPLADEAGVDSSYSVRAGYFLDSNRTRMSSSDIDSTLVGKYEAFSSTGIIGNASVSKNLPGGWALEVGMAYPPVSWSAGYSVGYTFPLGHLGN